MNIWKTVLYFIVVLVAAAACPGCGDGSEPADGADGDPALDDGRDGAEGDTAQEDGADLLDGDARPDDGVEEQAQDAPQDVDADEGGGGGMWVTGYYGEWQIDMYPVENIDWSALTHIVMHRVGPRGPAAPSENSPYSTINSDYALGQWGPGGIIDFAARASAGGVKTILGFGGSADHDGWVAAASDANRAQFVADILDACEAWGYDGVDIDWEPVNPEDQPQVVALAGELRSAAPAGFIITVPTGVINTNFGMSEEEIAFWRAVEPNVDQMSPMSYCGTGPWGGWVTWHFNPLFGQGPDHPVDVSSTMTYWADNVGIPRPKLGIGIGFYSMGVGSPVTGILQDYAGAQVYSFDGSMRYGNVVRHFLDRGGATRQWDDVSKVPYLSWPAPFQPTDTWTEQYGAGDEAPSVQFLSYEDEQSIEEKGRWARENDFGGCIIWTINEGTAWPYGADGYANPVLDAVKRAFID